MWCDCMHMCCIFLLEFHPPYRAKWHKKSHPHCFLGEAVSSFCPNWVHCHATLTLTTRGTIRSHKLGTQSFIRLSFLQTPATLGGAPGLPHFQRMGYKSRASHDTLSLTFIIKYSQNSGKLCTCSSATTRLHAG